MKAFQTLALSAALSSLGLLWTGCAHDQGPARFSGAPQAFEIFQPVPEEETTKRTEQRTDIYVNTTSGEPIPYIVSKSTIGPINRQGGRVRLFGDKEGHKGWKVDNFVLFEILGKDGLLLSRFVVGFQQGASIGSEQIDSLGPMQFQFGPGEIDITRFLPEFEDVTIQATALDTGSTGAISSLWMILSENKNSTSGSYDFRD